MVCARMVNCTVCKRPTMHHDDKCVICKDIDNILNTLEEGMSAITCAVMSPEQFEKDMARKAFKGLRMLKQRIKENRGL